MIYDRQLNSQSKNSSLIQSKDVDCHYIIENQLSLCNRNLKKLNYIRGKLRKEHVNKERYITYWLQTHARKPFIVEFNIAFEMEHLKKNGYNSNGKIVEDVKFKWNEQKIRMDFFFITLRKKLIISLHNQNGIFCIHKGKNNYRYR